MKVKELKKMIKCYDKKKVVVSSIGPSITGKDEYYVYNNWKEFVEDTTIDELIIETGCTFIDVLSTRINIWIK